MTGKGKENVSELVVVGFRDQYRACDVLNELKQHDWLQGEDLDHAVAVTLDEAGKARVQLSVDLSANETTWWASLWGSLLGVTLFLPTATQLAEAASVVSNGGRKESNGHSHSPCGDPSWWRSELGISEDFLRDVGAVVKPGASAIFMRLLAENIPVALGRLQNYGSMVIHTRLTPEQDDKISSFFALT